MKIDLRKRREELIETQIKLREQFAALGGQISLIDELLAQEEEDDQE